jgi:hypothetical protein
VPAFVFLAVAKTAAGLIPYLLREPEAVGVAPTVHDDQALLAHVSSR